MSLNPKVKLIQDAEAEIAKLNGEEDRMRKLYMQDGQLDAAEEQALDRIKGKIGKLQTALERLKAEVAAAKAEWEGHGAEWSEAASKLAALQEFQHPKTAEVADDFPVIEASVADQRWEDATAGNQALQSSLAPIWEDYETQKAAQAEYDPLRSSLDGRMAEASAAPTQTKEIVASNSAMGSAVSSMDSHVAARNYVEALALARLTDTELSELEMLISRVAQQKIDFDTRLAALQIGLGEASSCDFAKLAEQQADIAAQQDATMADAALPDYDLALPKLESLTSSVNDFLMARDQLEADRLAYEQALKALDGRLNGVNGSTDQSTEEAYSKVVEAQTAVTAAAEAEEFVEALDKVGELEAAIAALEELIADRDLYKARREALEEELQRTSVSKAEWAYLEPIQAQIQTALSETEAAAAAEDFVAALDNISTLEAALVAFQEAMDAKKVEYETARAAIDAKILHYGTCSYPLDAQKTAIDSYLSAVDTAVSAEDWAGALEKLGDVDTAFTDFQNGHDAHDAELKKKITTALPDLEAAANDPANSRATTCAALKRIVGELQKAASSTEDLSGTDDLIADGQRVKNELTAMSEIYKRLDDAEADDETARKIVEEMKASGDLGKLSPEARNVLIEKLMKNGLFEEITPDEKNAIRDIWASTTKLDENFSKMDKATTKKITDAMANDPKMKEYAANWSTMSNDEKQKAMEKVAGMVGGKDGWNLPGIEDLKLSVDGGECTTDSGLRGWHSSGGALSKEEISICMCNNYTLPDGSKWNPKDDFKDVIMNLSHEVGHGYQEDMMKRLKDGKIKPGDPEYEQARALSLDRAYFKEYPDDYSNDGRAYIHSPMEQQSRQTANRMRGDLPPEYGEGYLQETTHPGP